MILIREAKYSDWPSFSNLERKIWGEKNIETVSRKTFLCWLETNKEGFLIAISENKLVGYVYFEVIQFRPNPTKLPTLSYKDSLHTQTGNSIHAISMVSVSPRAGKKLIEFVIGRGRKLQKEYLVSLCRMPGLSQIVSCKITKKLALGYAINTALLVNGLIHEKLRQPTETFPNVKKDPVLGRFLKAGNILLGVTKSPFRDPESDYHALIYRRI
jgi:hypothetical protein